MQQNYRIFIFEDEPPILDSIKIDLKAYPNVQIAATATTFDELYQVFATTQRPFDFSLLDVRIGNRKCFELFEKFDRQLLGLIYIVSAFDDRIEQDMQLKIGNYTPISKPFDKIVWAQLLQNMNSLITNVERLTPTLNHYAIPLRGERNEQTPKTVLRDKDIVVIEAEGNRSIFYCVNDKGIIYPIESSLSLKEVEALLKPSVFLRVHKSYIVNQDCIEEYGPLDGKTGILTLLYDFDPPISYSNEYTSPYFKP